MYKRLCLLFYVMAIAATGLVTSCKKTEINFAINGNKALLPITDVPASPDDSLHVLKVQLNEEVVFEDLTTPAGKVKVRQWDFDGDGISNFETEDLRASISYPEPGFYKVVLCINGTQFCLAKCVYVMPAPAPDTTAQDTAAVAVVDEPANTPPPVKQNESLSKYKSPKLPSSSGGGPSQSVPAPSTPKPAPATSSAPLKPTAPPVTPQPSTPVKPTAPPVTDNGGKLTGAMASVGRPISQRKADADCLEYKETSFSTTIRPTRKVQLSSFVLYADGCGGVRYAISGGDVSESGTATLVKGRSPITFDDDIELAPGMSYTLTCTAIANYGACTSGKTPHFEDGSDCGGAASNAAVQLDAKGNAFIYDLKFRY